MLGRGRVLCVGALCSESRLQGLCAPTLQCWRSTPHPEVRTAGRLCSASSSLPRKHSPRLGARVLVAAPADRLGPLPVVTQVPLDHVVISSAPAAVFGELDPWREGSLLSGLGSARPPTILAQSLRDCELWRARSQSSLPLCLCNISSQSHFLRKPPDQPISGVPAIVQVGIWLCTTVPLHRGGPLQGRDPAPGLTLAPPAQPQGPTQAGWHTPRDLQEETEA